MPQEPVAFTEKVDASMVEFKDVVANHATVPLMVVAKVKTTTSVASAILNFGFFQRVVNLIMK